MEIKVKQEYFLDVDNSTSRKCRCGVSIYLPVTREDKLQFVLRNPDKRLLNSPLSSTWGVLDGDSRSLTTILSSKSWDDLSREVDEMISSIVSKLKQIKEDNERLLAEKPKDKAITIEI